MKRTWKMLTVLLLVAAIANLIFIFWPPKGQQKSPAVANDEQYKPDIEYRVSLEYAEACINSYKERFVKDSVVQYFTVDRQDLFQTVQLDVSTPGCPVTSKYEYARAYIGYDTATHQFHIFFTPVEGVVADSAGNIVSPGKDVILKGPYGNIDRQTGRRLSNGKSGQEEIGPYMLDLNAPCPTTCDGPGIVKAAKSK